MTERRTGIGATLRAARARAKLTQGALGAQVGVTASWVRELEKLVEVPDSPSEALIRMAGILGVDLAVPDGPTYSTHRPPLDQATDVELAAEQLRRAQARAGASPLPGPHAVPDLPPSVQEMRGERFDLPSPLDDLPVTQDNDPSTERGGRSDPGTA